MLRKSFDGEVYYWWDDGKPYPRARKADKSAADQKTPEHDTEEAAANSAPKDSGPEGENYGRLLRRKLRATKIGLSLNRKRWKSLRSKKSSAYSTGVRNNR